MHDPMTVAFDIKRPWPRVTTQPFERKIWGRFYWPTWVTIWHVDPEADGTDDSCGWFKRARHLDPAYLERVRQDFEFHWDRDRHCWFSDTRDQLPRLSTISITLHMFRAAAKAYYTGRWFDPHGWKGMRRFMRRHLDEVLTFAEAPLDSMRPFIEQVYGPTEDTREDRIRDAAATVAACVVRWEQPWYRHARWHVWHWRLQVHPVQAFKRWAFSRCAGCGRRFTWGYSPVSHSWNGTGPRWFRSEDGVYHSDCSNVRVSSVSDAVDPHAGVSGKPDTRVEK